MPCVSPMSECHQIEYTCDSSSNSRGDGWCLKGVIVLIPYPPYHPLSRSVGGDCPHHPLSPIPSRPCPAQSVVIDCPHHPLSPLPSLSHSVVHNVKNNHAFFQAFMALGWYFEEMRDNGCITEQGLKSDRCLRWRDLRDHCDTPFSHLRNYN